MTSSLTLGLAVACYGPALRAQARGHAPPTALLEQFEGEADVSLPEQHPARANDALPAGARLRVSEGGNARVRFSNGATLRLEGHTALHFFGPASPPPPNVPPTTNCTLARGRAHFVLGAPTGRPAGRADHLPLDTPGATVTFGPGEAVVSVDSARVTRVMALRGRVRVRAMGRDIVVREGQGLRVEVGRPPLPPGPLPAPPAWSSAFPPRTLLSPGATANLRATFAPAATPDGARGRRPAPPGPNAGPRPVRHYHLQLARSADFRELLFERVGAATDTTFETGPLRPGTYYARVAAVDVDRMEGVFSQPASFLVAAPQVTPGAPGRRASVTLPAGFFCGLDGALPSPVTAPVPLAAARNHRLRCGTTLDGRDAVDIDIAALDAGPLSHEVRMEPSGFDAAGGMRVLVIRLRDATGTPVAYADIAVTARPAAVQVDPVIEAEERGVYTTRVVWPRGVTGMRLEFVVNNAERFEFAQGNAP